MRGPGKHLPTTFLLLFWFAAPSAAGPDTRLIDAVKKQDPAAVRALVKAKVDVNAPDGEHATALHWSVLHDDMDTADVLIGAGARVGSVNDYGVTPLWLACMNRNALMIQRLLKAGADSNASLTTGETVLMTCARTGNPDTIKALVKGGADVNAVEKLQGQTALMWAVAQGHPEVVRALLDAGADVHRRSNVKQVFVANGVHGALLGSNVGVDYDKGGFSALLFAARQGGVESARLLLMGGANANETAADGASALVVASLSGHTELGIFLLDKGANPNADGAGYTALHAAILRSDVTLARALVAHGANPNAVLTKGTPVPRITYQWFLSSTLAGITPYLLAAKFAEGEIMRVLASAGADSKATMKDDGTTALMAAAGVGSQRDRRMRTLTDETLTEDEEKRVLDAVKTALELGGDVDARNKVGDTALHGAANKGYQSVVDLLTAHGGKMDLKNAQGRTPADLLERSRKSGNVQQ